MSASLAVTGANGHVGTNLTRLFLSKGLSVHALVRPGGDHRRLAHLRQLGQGHEGRLKFFEVDLADKRGLANALAGCVGLFHTAAPTFLWDANPSEQICEPIVGGTLNLIKAAHRVGLQRVVYTSSCASIGFRAPHDRALNEGDWNAASREPQFVAKMQAEERGSELASRLGLEFIRVCPPSILGPHFYQLTPSTSPYLAMLRGKLPFIPRLRYHVVDVRDLAEAQWLIWTRAKPRFERYIVAGPYVEPALILSSLRAAGVARRQLPKAVLPPKALCLLAGLDYLAHKLTGKRRELTTQLIEECGDSDQRLDTSRFCREFGWQTRSYAETLGATLAWLESQYLGQAAALSGARASESSWLGKGPRPGWQTLGS